MLAALEPHPHAAAVLGAALEPERGPAHAYLLHGPAGTGKRDAARAFAAELLSRGARDPANARARVEHGSHPDLTWVAPSGAHEMLRRDVDEAVVGAAARTPFEAPFRVFVLERADTMNDEAANSLLKTLEEPPPYVVLLLLTDRPSQVLPTIASRCQGVRFDALGAEAVAQRLQSRGVAPDAALACARLSLGDGEKALALGLADGPALRAARRGVRPRAARRPRLRRAVGAAAQDRARARPRRARAGRVGARRGARLPAQEGAQAARDGVRRARPARRAPRRRRARSTRRCSWSGSGTATSRASPPARPSSPTTPTACRRSPRTPRGATAGALREALEIVEDARARLALNVDPQLSFEALAYRLERLLAP